MDDVLHVRFTDSHRFTPVNALFVYGSLAPGKRNARYLSSLKGVWQKATVKGYLYEQGTPKTGGYPAVRLSEGDKKVNGLLFRSIGLARCWSKLDAFEGSAYCRVLTIAELEDGQKLPAYIYALAD